MCELILQNLKVSQDDLNYALLFAATHRNKKLFDVFLHNGADNNINLFSEIFTDMCNFLEINATEVLEKGISKHLNLDGILHCNHEPSYIIVKFLLVNNIDINLNKPYLIYFIDQDYQDYNIAELLINYGININAKNNFGGTALMHAASYNKPNIVKLLLKYGADRSIRDMFDRTPYERAKFLGYPQIQDLLEDKEFVETSSSLLAPTGCVIL